MATRRKAVVDSDFSDYDALERYLRHWDDEEEGFDINKVRVDNRT